jgi:internalin A
MRKHTVALATIAASLMIFALSACGEPQQSPLTTQPGATAPASPETPAPSVAAPPEDSGFAPIDLSVYSMSEDFLQFQQKSISSFGFLKDFKNLRSLEIRGCDIADGAEIPHIGTLSELTVYDARAVPLAAGNPQAEMRLGSIGARFEDFDALDNYKNLAGVSFENCAFADDIALPHCPALLKAEIFNCGERDAMILLNNPQIEELYLGGVSDISALSQFKRLRHLDLTYNDVADLTPLAGCESLESLVLTDGNYNLRSLKPLFGLKNLTRIQMGRKTYENIPREELEYFGADPDAVFPEGGIIEVD